MAKASTASSRAASKKRPNKVANTARQRENAENIRRAKGRPRVPLDVIEVERLAMLHSTYDDAAAHFNISLSTFNRRMKEPEYRGAWEDGQKKGIKLWYFQTK